MIVNYRLASRAQIFAWQALAEGTDSFNTTVLHSSFITGHTVMFASKNPMTPPENELGLKDIDIDDDATFIEKPGFDYWRGALNLIIVT